MYSATDNVHVQLLKAIWVSKQAALGQWCSAGICGGKYYHGKMFLGMSMRFCLV